MGQTDGRTDGPAARVAPAGPRGAPAPPRELGQRLPGPRGAARERSAELSPGGSHCKRVAPQAGQQRSGAGPRGSPATGTPPHGPTPYLSPGHATRASHDLWLASSARSQEGPPQTPAPTGGKKETARRPWNRLQTAGGGGPAAPPSRPWHTGPAPGPPGRAWSCSNPMGTRRGARSRHKTKLDPPATTQLAGGGGRRALWDPGLPRRHRRRVTAGAGRAVTRVGPGSWVQSPQRRPGSVHWP